jgi:hypothetical protein
MSTIEGIFIMLSKEDIHDAAAPEAAAAAPEAANPYEGLDAQRVELKCEYDHLKQMKSLSGGGGTLPASPRICASFSIRRASVLWSFHDQLAAAAHSIHSVTW